MCGIAGIYEGKGRSADREQLLTLAGELSHRGPDGTGLLLDGPFGMINTRLAVIDLENGDQPQGSEDGRYWLVQNGEIYNYRELKHELEQLGHRFRTTSDTEVLLHAFEQWGAACLPRLNGDFAFAVWDTHTRELFLARDRFGVRPLYLTHAADRLAFASEVRALLRLPGQARALSADAVVQTFQLWSTLPGTSAFEGVTELPAGHWLRWKPGVAPVPVRWWGLDFAGPYRSEHENELADELRELLHDAVAIRTRADVPVGAYVSGGLDSSATAALMQGTLSTQLHGFSVGFTDSGFDETPQQDELARALNLNLQRLTVSDADIAELFPRVIELSERPMLRTAPAPLLRLSGLARHHGFPVVLTGEGADELFGGYSIFKEAAVRRFWAKDPESKLRPRLFARLHPYLVNDLSRGGGMLANYFGYRLQDTANPLYSHLNRYRNGQRNLRFLTGETLSSTADPELELLKQLPDGFADFDPLGQAQYLEMRTFMEGYLLHSQGDRMLMGHGVEGRFPFLDHRLAQFAMALPARLRLNGLQEKYLLRKAVGPLLPKGVAWRTKRPYRAPLLRPFLSAGAPAWVADLLDQENVSRSGLFNADMVGRLVSKARARLDSGLSEMDEMALMGVMSSLLLKQQLVDEPALAVAAVPDRVIDLNRVAA